MADRIAAVFRRYFSGEIPVSDLQSLLADILQSEPAAAQTLLAQLEEFRAQNRLPIQLHNLLISIAEDEQRPVQQPEPDDATRVKGVGPQGPASPQPQNTTPPSATETERIEATLVDSANVEKILEPGALIANRFLLEEQIGTGGMGEVFRAKDLHYAEADDRDPIVAIKFLGHEFRRHPESRKALQREVRKTHRLAHPNIVTVYNFDIDGQLIYMTMEFLRGSPLDRLIRTKGLDGFEFSEAWPIVEGAGAALAYAHKEGFVHSDFKPANIFVTNEQRVKLLDFGIARAAAASKSDDQLTRFDVSDLGALTPTYASPEMLQGLEPDQRDDVYALACVSYELLAGRHPFDRKPASVARDENMAVRPIRGLPRRKLRALKDGLEFARSDRTPSVERFLLALGGGNLKWQVMKVATIVFAGLIVATTAAGGYYWSQRCPGFDRDFLESVRVTARSEASTLDEGQYQRLANNRDALLNQGAMLLDLSVDDFSPSYLSIGSSNAFGAYSRALVVDADDAVAIEGIALIIDRYEAQAEMLLADGDFSSSAEVAGYGLALHPKHCGLNKIARQANRKAN